MEENYGAVLHGPNDIRIEKLPMPVINENEVLIKMSCVGICGSDVKIYSTGKCGNDVIKEPFIIGHEGAGVVVKVGKNVTTLQVGDRVAIEPTQPCRVCEFCKLGKYNLCDKPHYCSSLGADGNLSCYYKHTADFCHKIPANVSLEEGAAVQPLAIAIHAVRRAGVTLGCSVAVLGAGPIGLLCALTANAMGARDIVMTVDKIIAQLGGRPDITIDACGFAAAQRVAMKVTKKAGTVLVVGIGEPMVEVPLSAALLNEIDIRGSYRIANTYPAALQAVSKRSIDLAPFITHHFPIEKTREALELAKSGAAMKVIIHLPH